MFNEFFIPKPGDDTTRRAATFLTPKVQFPFAVTSLIPQIPLVITNLLDSYSSISTLLVFGYYIYYWYSRVQISQGSQIFMKMIHLKHIATHCSDVCQTILWYIILCGVLLDKQCIDLMIFHKHRQEHRDIPGIYVSMFLSMFVENLICRQRQQGKLWLSLITLWEIGNLDMHACSFLCLYFMSSCQINSACLHACTPWLPLIVTS